ncbi:MAG: hypothetical protein IBJ00_02095 [Alphaproteobacteria bacterium]|nr:hypothetical protein [Alphaproteobacteria bacterium]
MYKFFIAFFSTSLIFSAQASNDKAEHPIQVKTSLPRSTEIPLITSSSQKIEEERASSSSSHFTSIINSFNASEKAAYDAFELTLNEIIHYATKRQHFLAEKEQILDDQERLLKSTNVQEVAEALTQLKETYLKLCLHPFLAFNHVNAGHIHHKLDYPKPDMHETRKYTLSGSTFYLKVTQFGGGSSGNPYYVIGDSKEKVDTIWQQCDHIEKALELNNLYSHFKGEFLPRSASQYTQQFFEVTQPLRHVQQWEKLLRKEVEVRGQLDYYNKSQSDLAESKTPLFAKLEGIISAKEFLKERQVFFANLTSLDKKALDLYKALEEQRKNNLAREYPQIFLSLRQ